MRIHWKTVPLKDLCENFKSDIVDGPFGANLKREHYKNSGTPVLKIQNIKPFEIILKKMDYVDEAKAEELKRHSYKKGDIIITKLGLPLGVSAIVENIDDGIIVADLVRVRANKVNTNYLCYHLNSPITNAFLNEQKGGSTRPRVRITAVRELPINVPPLPEQERIVSILDKAFEGIDKAIAQTEQNLASARELFESYLNNIFTQKGDDWVEKKLGDCMESISTGPFGSMLHKADYVAGGIPLINPANIINYKIIPNLNKTVTEDTMKRLPSHKVSKGDIIVARRGEIGRCAVVTDEQDGWLCGTGSFKLTVNDMLLPDFVVTLLRTNNVRSSLEAKATGATVKNISNKSLAAQPISVPPVANQRKTLSVLGQLQHKTQHLEALSTQKLNDLKELKQSLLQQAFAGELTKEDAA